MFNTTAFFVCFKKALFTLFILFKDSMSIFMVPEHPISCDSTNLVYNSHSRVAVWWEWPLCVTDIPESFLDNDYGNTEYSN